MTHFAVFAPPFPSHFRALEALAVALIERGHRVTFVHQADAAGLLRDPRVGFAAVGQASHPPGSLAGILARTAHPGGPIGLRRVIADVAASTDMLCREGPAALLALGVEAILADQMEAAGGLLAEGLGLPWASVACAVPINREPRIPLPVMPWGYARTPFAERLNDSSARVYDWLMAPHGRVIRQHARRFGLPERTALHECLSPHVQISQTVAAFDFPRETPPPGFHAVGPLRDGPAREAPLELPGDDGRPLVFASLGTLQGGRFRLFRRIARACQALDLQLLLAHCGKLDAARSRRLEAAGARWVTDFAPQQAALQRATLAVTHAGLNTVMDALLAGTPMLTLPIAFDQPGVAARVVHSGCGLRLTPALAGTGALRRHLRRLLDEPAFTARAQALGEAVADAGGAPRAAALIEAALGRARADVA